MFKKLDIGSGLYGKSVVYLVLFYDYLKQQEHLSSTLPILKFDT